MNLYTQAHGFLNLMKCFHNFNSEVSIILSAVNFSYQRNDLKKATNLG